MNGRTHAAAGTMTICAIIQSNFHANEISSPTGKFVLIAGVLIGALVLDIDNNTSFISNAFPPIAWIVGKLTKHRGIIHILLPFVLIGMYFYQHYLFWLWIGIGGLSHILIDVIGNIFGITCKSKGETSIFILLWICVFAYIGYVLWIKYNLHMPKYVLFQLNVLKKYMLLTMG